MSKYYGDLVFSTGEYTNEAGETKKRWQKAGAVFRDEENGRLSVKLESVPVGQEWSGWFNIFAKDNAKQKTGSNQIVDNDDNIDISSIPF